MKFETITRSKWVAVAPLVLAFVVTASYVYTHKVFVECKYERIAGCDAVSMLKGLGDTAKLTGNPATPEEYLQRSGARVLFKFFVWGDLIAKAFAVIGFLLIIGKYVGRYGILATLLLSTLIMIGAVATDQMSVFKPLAEVTINIGDGGIQRFDQIVLWLNASSYFAITVMVFALCSLLYAGGFKTETRGKNKRTADAGMTELDTLEEKRKCLSFILYTTAALLVFGLVRYSSGFDFARTFLPNSGGDVVIQFLATITTELGAFYSIMIAIAYLPTAFLLQNRAETAFVLAHPGEDAPAGLTKLGFNFSLKESIPRILAIAGLLITGAIAEALTRSFPK